MAPEPEFPLSRADLSLLGPLAEHRLLIVPQVALLLGVSDRTAARRLARLHGAGLVLHRQIFAGAPHAVRITSPGLRVIDSSLKAPNLNLNEYRHDVGVAWLWLAARGGSFGSLTGMTSDRRMQSEDAGRLASGGWARWGIGVGLFGPHGNPQRHYPDLMLETASGHRVGVELELTSKSVRRMDRIMWAYASDARIDHVLYLAGNQRIAQRVTDSARRAGIGDRVHVKLLARDGIEGVGVGNARVAPRQVTRTLKPRGAER
jgi:hypothetical protein